MLCTYQIMPVLHPHIPWDRGRGSVLDLPHTCSKRRSLVASVSQACRTSTGSPRLSAAEQVVPQTAVSGPPLLHVVPLCKGGTLCNHYLSLS